MNANRLRKKNKVNGLNPTYRNKMNYVYWIDGYNRYSENWSGIKQIVSVFNWKAYTAIADSGYLRRVNNEVD